jgi:hypothetical protein
LSRFAFVFNCINYFLGVDLLQKGRNFHHNKSLFVPATEDCGHFVMLLYEGNVYPEKCDEDNEDITDGEKSKWVKQPETPNVIVHEWSDVLAGITFNPLKLVSKRRLYFVPELSKLFEPGLSVYYTILNNTFLL